MAQKTIRCKDGITEHDINNYFKDFVKNYGQAAMQNDARLQRQAQEMVRAQKTRALQNAVLYVVGDIVAVRFVTGKVRRKIRVEHNPPKVLWQVRVENLICGFFRTALFTSAVLEIASGVLSLGSIFQSQFTEAESYSLTVAIFIACGDVFRLPIAFLVAIETINMSTALFTPVYRGVYSGGSGGKMATYGIGSWPLVPRRWLWRGLLYAVVASRGQLQNLRAADFLIPVDIFSFGQLCSGWTLAIAAILSMIIQLLLLPFPSLLKTPWTSVTVPLDNAQLVPASATACPESASGDTSRFDDPDVACAAIGDGAVGQEDRKGGAADKSSARCCRHCPSCLAMACQCRSFSGILFVKSVGVFLCLATAMFLFSCHVTRLVHIARHRSAIIPLWTNLPATAAAILLSAVVGVYQASGFVRTITTRKPLLPHTVRTSLLLHAACLSTFWSRDVVTWLTEICGWSDGALGAALATASVTLLLLPAILRNGDSILARLSEPRRLCGPPPRRFSCSLGASSREPLLRCLFAVAVMLAVSGMIFAIVSLPLPIARVQFEYTEHLLKAVNDVKKIQEKTLDHNAKLIGLMDKQVCGPNVKDLLKQMYQNVQAASLMKDEVLRDYCDKMEPNNSRQDPFCNKYCPAKLYFDGKMDFNKTLHDVDIKNMYTDADREEFLLEAIQKSKSDFIRSMDESSKKSVISKKPSLCILGVCIAQNAALFSMLIPFAGVGFKVIYLGLVAADIILRLMIKLVSVQNIFLKFKWDLERLTDKFNFYKEEKTVQFSLDNFNLPRPEETVVFLNLVFTFNMLFPSIHVHYSSKIYLAYPALLTGCVGMLVGFWYRRGAPFGHRRRASMAMLLPLVFLNVFGMCATFVWTHLVQIIGEWAPMVETTVSTRTGLTMLRVSYGLTITAIAIFLLLEFVEPRFMQIPKPKHKQWEGNCTSRHTPQHPDPDTAAATGLDNNSSDLELESIDATTAAATGVQGTEDDQAGATGGGIMITAGVESSGGVWILALLISLTAVGLMTTIIWKPLFTLDYDLNASIKTHMKEVEKGIEAATAVRKTIYDPNGSDRCTVVDLIFQAVINMYMDSLKKMAFNGYKNVVDTVYRRAQRTVVPTTQLIQIPLLLSAWVPFLVIVFSAIMTKVRPAWVPRARTMSRMINAMAWLAMGWLTSGMLFLTALAEDKVVTMYRFQVFIGEGFAYVIGACIMQIMAAQELRISAMSPIL